VEFRQLEHFELRLRQAGPGTLLEEVRNGTLDLALVAPAGRPTRELTMRRLAGRGQAARVLLAMLDPAER
jgi:hypothetical protein